MDVADHNRRAWDRLVGAGNRWTVPVGADEVEQARNGELNLRLTPCKFVPRTWFGKVREQRVLCLASGGGQQAPLLAAAGAIVTSLDASPKQLDQDRMVARRDGLSLTSELGDMRDLSRFASQSFDLVFHPVSNCFIPDVQPVWREAYRVLKPGGALLAGFANPILYLFDPELQEQGTLTVRYKLPYSDLTSIPAAERDGFTADGEPLEFGHTLSDQIGGQLDAGFLLAGMYEDVESSDENERLLSNFMSPFIATRSVRNASG